MKIAIIGSKGLVGSTLVEFFNHSHEVLCVDLDTKLTLEGAATIADVVWIVTLPIEGVAELFARATKVMRVGTLLVHGTSIENPSAPHNINTAGAEEKGITVCHCHFHFRPETPLARTLFGQSVSISITGQRQDTWESWLENELVPFQPLLYHLGQDEHDHITTVSQLVHTVSTFLFGSIWQTLPSQAVQKAIQIGGPPCRSLVRTILRTASSGKVMSSILLNHPYVLSFIDNLQRSLNELRALIVEKNGLSLEERLGSARTILDTTQLKAWDTSTAQLVRWEADLKRTVATFVYSKEQNRPGLLVRILKEFGSRDISLTTTFAHNTPDGGCIIMIGVWEDTSAVQTAIQAVNAWSKE